MGRLLILIVIIVVIVLVWRAFGPGTWGKGVGRSGLAAPGPRTGRGGEPQRIKGPDDDEDFLWRLEKQRFDEEKARRRRAEEEQERRRKENGPDNDDGRGPSGT